MIVIVALSANSLAIPQSMVIEFGIGAQNLHIDDLEHDVDELEHKLAKLSKEITPWDVQMLTARMRRLEDDKCPAGEVSCGGDFPECVSHLFVCDGHVDCHNGRDEDEDVCDSEVVHVGSTYQGVVEWQGCESVPDSNSILTVTSVYHAPFFNNRVFLRATIVSDSTKFSLPHPVATSFHGDYSFAERKLVLLPDETDHSVVHHPYKVICTFNFGDNAHADCTINEVASSAQCAKFRVVKV